MIEANKEGVFAKVVAGYMDRKFRSTFRGLWVRGSLPTDGVPRLIYLNHDGFWDGFVVHVLSRSVGWDGFALVEERNLARYRFLTRIGGFSIRKQDAGSSLESLRYAKRLLHRPGAAVFVFPQGVLTPNARPPLQLEPGVEVLARVARCMCLPMAVRYAFFEHERPDVLLEVGESHTPLPLEHFQQNLDALVARVQEAPSTDGYRLQVAGAKGAADQWDAVRRLPHASVGPGTSEGR